MDNDFPYNSFPIRLEYLENKKMKVCYFQDKTHLNRYLIRHNIKKKDATIKYKE